MPSSLTKTAMSNGHYFAFGNTEDRMLAVALGKKDHRRGPRTFVTHYGQHIASAAVRATACATAARIRAVLSHAARTSAD